MKGFITTFCLATILSMAASRTLAQQPVQFDFCGQHIRFPAQASLPNSFTASLSQQTLAFFYQQSLDGRYEDVIRALNEYRLKNHPDDWLFYQLVRRTAEKISPKKDNYYQYTLFKWYFLVRSGYDAILTFSGNTLLFYVQCDENTYNIPNREMEGRQYVCLNYHDYGRVDFSKNTFALASLPRCSEPKTFSYRITHIPDMLPGEYKTKDLHFNYNENEYHFSVKLTPQIQQLFNNYPVVDYESYLNIPLSRETYNSLIPQLKKNVRGMKAKNGVDYLMRFTRYAFLFEADTEHFGSEKRLSPEQTLFYDQSDCEDRVALFFYLVKEVYDLPMIVLAYPKHVTIAVQFDKPVGPSITYQGERYSVCEPTPQQEDLQIGELLPSLSNTPYQVAYAYHPKK